MGEGSSDNAPDRAFPGKRQIMKPVRPPQFLALIGLLIVFAGCSNASAAIVLPTATPELPTIIITTTPSPSPTPTLTATPFPTATPTAEIVAFDGQRAYQDVERQMDFGPRLPGSQAHAQFVDWAIGELATSGWIVDVQETTYLDQPVKNIIAKRGVDLNPWIILGAHYDSRAAADNDPDPTLWREPVPGANDGASGVAVLLELARVLPKNVDKQVWLVLFDAEDQGRIAGWDWIMGSRAFAESLSGTPDSVVIVDMIGDADLNIYMERSSNPDLIQEIWQVAEQQGHGAEFIPEYKYRIIDDHTPFLQKGLRAIDIIDFDYAYWHTVGDTADKVSAQSLFTVGDTLLHWLNQPQN